MRILDRYVLRFYLLAYGVCFVSLLSLYVVVDLFSRVDEFVEHSRGARDLLANVGAYYLFRIPWFFQRLSGVIGLMAAMFALAWLEQHNEISAWLAAGIPGRRLLYPILAATVAVIALNVANRELIVPRCSAYLQRTADDARGLKSLPVQHAYDSHGIHLTGRCGDALHRTISLAQVTLPPEVAGNVQQLEVQEMFYRPRRGLETSGWMLNGTTPDHIDCRHPALNWWGPGQYFLHSDVSFQRLTRKPDWFYYEPTPALVRLVHHDASCQRRGEVVALLHRRCTGPLLDLILVLLGMPIMFGRFDRNLFLKAGVCLIVYVIFQGSQFVCTNLAQQELFDPILAAWLPVFVFGPLALVLADGMKT
jgi:lipopolysaccharide export system permease protein